MKHKLVLACAASAIVAAVLAVLCWNVWTWATLTWNDFQIMREDIRFIHEDIEVARARKAEAARRAAQPQPPAQPAPAAPGTPPVKNGG